MAMVSSWMMMDAVDVGLNGQGEDSRLGKGAAGHDIVQAQDGGAELIDIVASAVSVFDIGNRDSVADAEDQKDQQR